MENNLNLPPLKGHSAPAPRMTMDEYVEFVTFNLENVVDWKLIEKQIAEDKKINHVPFRL